MAFTTEDLRKTVLALVIGVMLVIVGSVGADITSSIGQYIITTLVNSGNFTQPTNYLNDVVSVLSPVFTILGVTLIVMASVFILRELLQSIFDFMR